MKIYLSLGFLVVLAAVWVWDWYAIVKQQPKETVSAMLLEWSQAWPILPFMVGVIIGHIFWPSR